MKKPRTPRFSITGSAQANHLLVHANLVGKLKGLGWLLSDFQNSDVLISYNHNRLALSKFRLNDPLRKIAILIRVEPKAVFPIQYNKTISRQYSQVITPGSVNDFIAGDFFVGWPYVFPSNPINPNTIELREQKLKTIIEESSLDDRFEWFDRPIQVSQIASNKVSPLRDSNYG